jgi:hypothetical protein
VYFLQPKKKSKPQTNHKNLPSMTVQSRRNHRRRRATPATHPPKFVFLHEGAPTPPVVHDSSGEYVYCKLHLGRKVKFGDQIMRVQDFAWQCIENLGTIPPGYIAVQTCGEDGICVAPSHLKLIKKPTLPPNVEIIDYIDDLNASDDEDTKE